MGKNIEIEMIANAYFNCAALLGFTLRFPIPDSMGNVNYDICTTVMGTKPFKLHLKKNNYTCNFVVK